MPARIASPVQYPPNIEGASLTVLGPLVLTADLLLLLGGEVIGDVEGLADLLWGLPLDHVGDGLASNIKEGLNIEIIGSLQKPVNMGFCNNESTSNLRE